MVQSMLGISLFWINKSFHTLNFTKYKTYKVVVNILFIHITFYIKKEIIQSIFIFYKIQNTTKRGNRKSKRKNSKLGGPYSPSSCPSPHHHHVHPPCTSSPTTINTLQNKEGTSITCIPSYQCIIHGNGKQKTQQGNSWIS